MISVIIPVYNVENYLRQCLDSILNQTYTDFEVICINDGSTDNSLNILKEYAQKDSRIKVISQKNKGPSKARNVGLKHANSEYICFIDSDDKIEPDFFEKLYAVRDMSDLITVKINYPETDAYKTRWHSKFNPKKETGLYKLTPSLFTKITMAVWGKLFKKSIIDKYKIKFLNGFHEDSNFLYCYMSHLQNIYFINEKLYTHILNNPNSLTFDLNNKKEYCNITNYIKLIKHLKKYGLFEKYKKSIFILFQRSVGLNYFLVPNIKKILKYFNITKKQFVDNIIKKIKIEISTSNGTLSLQNDKISRNIHKENISPHSLLFSSNEKKIDIFFKSDENTVISLVILNYTYIEKVKLHASINKVEINNFKINEGQICIYPLNSCFENFIEIPKDTPIHLHIEYEIVPEISKIRLLFSKYKYLYR